jgi:hypothetical protein
MVGVKVLPKVNPKPKSKVRFKLKRELKVESEAHVGSITEISNMLTE